MKTNITAFIALGVVTLGALALGTAQVLAYQGDYSALGPYHTEEKEIAMEKVMTTTDYEGWKALMTEDGRTPGVLRKIDTKEDFVKFAEAYKLGHAGKTAEANVIRAELGLGNGGGNRGGNGAETGAGTGNCVNE